MQHKTVHSTLLLALASLAIVVCPLRGQDTTPEASWWKGNLHTHSLWSDGDDFPEMIADWYQQHGYNFLALSDHNILSDGQKWMALEKIEARSKADALTKYRKRFGDAWVETRGEPGTSGYEIRLKPLGEFAPLLENAGKFIMIQGEEISDRAEGKPVHMNATNIKDLIEPLGGATVREAMANNLRAVLEQEKETGRQILPHLNHPNFGYAITAEDLAHVIQEQFFEVYNGHPSINHLGDDEHIGIEAMWDLANAIRLSQLSAAPLLGIATDDSHQYHGKTGARTGRGWVMVRSRYLTPEHLILAMKAGDFYASSGVELTNVVFDAEEGRLDVTVAEQQGAEYTTQFIATLKPTEAGALPAPDRIGKVVKEVTGASASYELTGDELYVRAVVTSSLPHADPSFADQKKQAWSQPVGWSTSVEE